MVTKPNIGEEGWGPVLNAALDELETDRIAGDDALSQRVDTIAGGDHFEAGITTTPLPSGATTTVTLNVLSVGPSFSAAGSEVTIVNDGVYDMTATAFVGGTAPADLVLEIDRDGGSPCAMSAVVDAEYFTGNVTALGVALSAGQVLTVAASQGSPGTGSAESVVSSHGFFIRRIGDLP